MRQAVILAGGKGARLRERLNGRPKPLVDFDGVPLLGRQIAALRGGGVTDILVLVSYAGDQIEAYCRAAEFSDLRITLLDDGEPRGTAGALLQVFDSLADRFLVVYGDTIFDVDLDAFWLAHAAARADGTLFLHPNDHPFDSDLVVLEEDGRISAIRGPPHDPEACLPNLVNAALYVLEREAIAFWRDAARPSDIARDLFPAMLRRGAVLRGYVSYEYVKDIGTPGRLDKAVRQFRSGFLERARRSRAQRAVFLDRDGTINAPCGHLSRAEQVELVKGAGEAIRRLNLAEFRVVVVTNQPVVARGETTFAELRRIHARMDTLLGREGAFVDAVYVCPHHPDAGFAGEVPELKVVCDCRKPSIGMIQRAKVDLNIDLAQSWFVGDTTTDMLAAERAGLRSILVATGEAGFDGKYAAEADFSVADLSGAVDFIARRHPRIVASVEPVLARAKPGQLILVGGLARQGKSTVAAVLRRALAEAGFSAVRLALDGYLLDLPDRRDGLLGRFNLPAAAAALRPWLTGGGAVVDTPVYDRIARTQSSLRLRKTISRDAILIAEGVPALLLNVPTERDITRIFVDGAEAARRRRVLADFVTRGRSPADAASAYEERQVDEAPLVRAGRDTADAILSLDDVFGDTRAIVP